MTIQTNPRALDMGALGIGPLFLMAFGVLLGVLVPGLAVDTDYHARVVQILKQTPLIDGHNDLPWEIRERFKGQLTAIETRCRC